MVTRLEEEIEAYKKQMEEHLRELEAKQATFVKASRKLGSIIARLSKVMDDYQTAYEDVLASGISVADAKANGINTLTTVIRDLQTQKRQSKTTPATHVTNEDKIVDTMPTDNDMTDESLNNESVSDSNVDQAQADESFTSHQY